MEKYKICTQCSTQKPIIDYYKPNHGKCKVCWNKNNSSRIKSKYHSDPEYKRKKDEYSKKYIKENNYWETWREKNRDKIKANNQKYKEYKKQWAQNQRKENIQFKLKETIRNRIYSSLKKKSNSSIFYLGCSIEDYILYLERQFDENMTWDNYGKYWEIDHIKPIHSFNLESESEIIECFNFSNTQPLQINENRRKRHKHPF